LRKAFTAAIREKLADLEPGLPPLPEPNMNPKDEGWLFDSRRDNREQLRHYKDRYDRVGTTLASGPQRKD
jgi:hypothetical protein